MLNAETTDAVMEALSDIMENPDQSFTAYDVTKAARSRTAANVRHADVRQLMHALYDNDFLTDYDRIDHTFWSDGRQEHAQLFCPVIGGDPNAYDPSAIQINKQSAVTKALQGITDSSDPLKGVMGATGVVTMGPRDHVSKPKPDAPNADVAGTMGVAFKPQNKPAEPAFTKPVTNQPAAKDPQNIVQKVKKRLSDLRRHFLG